MIERAPAAVPTILTVIGTTTALYFADAVLAPVAGALFIIAILWPLQSRLQVHLPRVLALAIVAALLLGIFLVFMSLLTLSFGRIGRSLMADVGQFQLLYTRLAEWLEGHGIPLGGVWADNFNSRVLLRVLQGISARLNTMVAFWLVVLVYVILGLLEVPDLGNRIRRLADSRNAAHMIKGFALASSRIRRYLLIRTIMSAATGLAVWALAAAFGLRLAAEWGIVAFALNYIPFIGPWIATLLPTCYALAQFQSPQSALVVFACLSAAQFVIGSYIEPRVAGNTLGISPSLVLFSVFLWTFLWGIFGAFIGVPITIAVLAFCTQFASTRWIAELWGTEGVANGELERS
ncbi:AI-2E family transporter [Rhizobium sp. CC1099]|uniref:AI-2E family transporter n=1 Tax=Rhizobium sp. CC1099 TaxID=3039160 RepID=UPI0024B208CA|nr:AI-2E family transporter [Rhizobium sp. CC1099]WFU89430.1 AI-2E family transporter [Rhizobium sp. CC1099]